MPETLTLRPATPADAPALSKLGIASFVAKFGQMYAADDLASFLDEVHSEAAVAAEIARPHVRYCLAERGGRLVAYCKMGLACSWPEHARGRNAIELKQLYTAPDATGGGLGTALMGWAFAIAQEADADEIQLSVWSGNDGAQRFYARHGFAKVADIHFMVGQQRDEEFLFALMLDKD